MLKNYRHGDLGLFGIEKLPEKLSKSDSKIFMVGSGGHNHTFDNGDFYPTSDGITIGFLVSKNTTLYHLEHGTVIKGHELREVFIEDGIYELRQQIEETHDGMKPVVD